MHSDQRLNTRQVAYLFTLCSRVHIAGCGR